MDGLDSKKHHNKMNLSRVSSGTFYLKSDYSTEFSCIYSLIKRPKRHDFLCKPEVDCNNKFKEQATCR